MSTTTQSNEKAVPAVPLQIELRDWFAGQALTGILSSGTTHMTSGQTIDGYHAMVAYGAYALADAMLSARQTTDREDGK